MTPENKAKALESIAEWLELDSVTHWDFTKALTDIRDLIQPPEEAEEIRRLKARIDELESEAKARSEEIYGLHGHISVLESAIEDLDSELGKCRDKEVSAEDRARLCDKGWDLTP